MAEGTRDYKRLESMLKESDQKRDKEISRVEGSLARVEGRLDAVIEEIKSMLQGLQNNESRSQIANQETGAARGSILGNPRGVQGETSVPFLNEHIFKYATKLEFPKFHGEGVDEWLFKVDQIFMLDKTLEQSRINVASLHLEGCALLWHKNFMKHKEGILRWEEYDESMASFIHTCVRRHL